MSRTPSEFRNFPDELTKLLHMGHCEYGPYRAISRFEPRYDDGDTILMMLDPGWDIYPIASVRLLGINAPERGTAAGNELIADMAEHIVPPGSPLVVFTSWKGRSFGRDKYGRLLGVVFARENSWPSPDEAPEAYCLNTVLVELGWAQEYTDWPVVQDISMSVF